MADRPGRELALLGALSAIGVALPLAVFLALGSAAAWQAGIAIAGAISSCYNLAAAATAASPPSLIAGGLLVTSAAVGLRSVFRQLLQTHRGVKPLQAFSRPSPRLQQACQRAGVAPSIAGEVLASVPTSFCSGILRRRIVVTSALADALSEDELAAILIHEGHHARCFDPARMMLARAAASAFFWLPLTRDLRDRYLVAKELSADQAAIRLIGPQPLGSALLKIATPGPTGSASFGADSLERRVDALLGEPQPPIPFGRDRVWATIAAVMGALGLVVWASTSPPIATHPSRTAVADMLRSPTIHGSAGMAMLAVLNFIILVVCGRLVSRWRRSALSGHA